MPYKRVGKCVYKELSNGELSKKPVGCSDSIEDAKTYLKKLYTIEIKEVFNEGLSPEVSQKAGVIFKSIIKDRGDKLFNKMGAAGEEYAYATAINKAKKAIEKQSMEATDQKLKEVIKDTLAKFTSKNEEVLEWKRELNEDDWMQKDDESDMAKSQITSIIELAHKLEGLIQNNEQLDSWVQSKLTLAQDYLDSVYNYMNGEEKQENSKLPVVIDLAQKVMERIKNEM